MPVEAQDAAEGLERVRVGEPTKDFIAAEFGGEKDDDFARERHHSLEQIAGRLAAVK